MFTQKYLSSCGNNKIMNNSLQTINDVFHKIDIYNSIIIYESHEQERITTLCRMLQLQDYPVVSINEENIETLYVLESNYRMFVMPSYLYSQYLFIKNFDLSCISVFFVTHDSNIFDSLESKMINHHTNYRIIPLRK